MAVIFAGPGGAQTVYLKGVFEHVLNVCSTLRIGTGERQMTVGAREEVMRNVDAMARQGLRMLAFAARSWDGPAEAARDDVERDMCLLGLVGIYDPPRECRLALAPPLCAHPR